MVNTTDPNNPASSDRVREATEPSLENVDEAEQSSDSEESIAQRRAAAIQQAETFENQYAAMFGIDDKKVYLTGIAEEEIGSTEGNTSMTGTVPFDVQPVVSESGSALYTEVSDIRQAGSIMIYMGSPGREFSINAVFVSRSQKDAEINRKHVQLLRSWRLPEKVSGDFAVRSPSRLRLTGFGKWLGSTTSITKGIPVRMTSLNIDMPDDTDYIMTKGTNFFVPIIWKVNMTLKETRSVNELKEFDIINFRTGNFSGW